ncbi:sortase [Bacillus haimaensis]|uniref:sortase domain-containing protein n=1 Tax=Bacillus haimaensis TaxID=3160967 RepID=UPI003AA7F40B
MQRSNKLILPFFALAILIGCQTPENYSAPTPEQEQPSSAPVEKKEETTVKNPQVEINSSEGTSSGKITKDAQITVIPIQLRIPAINVDAPIKPQGLSENGEMEVPEDGETIGWYEPGTKPGGMGNAVLVGHVDDYTGPAIFFNLKQLEVGDEILVEGENGETLTFVVKDKQAYPYDLAPIRQIFGPSNKKQLNLITCTGLYNRSTQNHEERLVVYTELKDS